MRERSAVRESASATRAPNEYEPAELGVPEMRPFPLKLTPGGNDPDEIDQV